MQFAAPVRNRVGAIRALRAVAGLVVAISAVALSTVGCTGPADDGSPPAAGSKPEDSDLWAVDLTVDDGTPKVVELRRLTDRAGYDNQPRFLPDGGAVYYTSLEGENADVWRYDFAAGGSVAVTDTPDREYSPTPMPDGPGFSVVRVEVEHNLDQRLWRFDADGANPELLLRWDNDVFQVGYYEWVTPDFVGLVLVHEPVPILGLAFLPRQMVPAEPADVNVGRCLRTVPGTRPADGGDSLADAMAEERNAGALGSGPWLAYVAKGAGENPGPRTLGDYTLPGDGWWLRYMAVMDGSSETVVRMPDGVEDFAFLPDGGVLVGQGGRVLHWPGRNRGADGWTEVADLSGRGVQGITRIDVDPRGARAVFAARR